MTEAVEVTVIKETNTDVKEHKDVVQVHTHVYGIYVPDVSLNFPFQLLKEENDCVRKYKVA